MAMQKIKYLPSLIFGSGQVMFMPDIWTGVLFLCGIFVGAYENNLPMVAWGAVVGLIASTFVGQFSGCPAKDIRQGLCGFNGILVGCAFPTFFNATIGMWIMLVICASATTYIRIGLNKLLRRWSLNSLTFPFVAGSWAFFIMAYYMDMPILPSTSHVNTGLEFGMMDFVVSVLTGISQVFLINSWITGLIFVIGIAICSMRAAIWSVGASAFSSVMALLLDMPTDSIIDGLYGFNPVLTGIALGTVFLPQGRKTYGWVVLGIVMTFFLQLWLSDVARFLNLPTFTASFCLITWLILVGSNKKNIKV